MLLLSISLISAVLCCAVQDKNDKKPDSMAVNAEARALLKDARCIVRESGVGDNASRVRFRRPPFVLFVFGLFSRVALLDKVVGGRVILFRFGASFFFFVWFPPCMMPWPFAH